MYTLIPLLEEFEKELMAKNNLYKPKDLNSVVIAIGGLSGVGKDEMARGIARELTKRYDLQLDIIGAGSFMRSLAAREGYKQANLSHFLQKIASNPKYAREIDIKIEKDTLKHALSGQNVIIHGRMTPFTIGAWGIGIWLTADPEIIANRISKDPRRPEYGLPPVEILEKNIKRDQADLARLENLYNINIKNCKERLDICYDTSNKSIKESVTFLTKRVIEKLKLRNKVIHEKSISR